MEKNAKQLLAPMKMNIQMFATTVLSDMVDPEVLGDMIAAELPNAIKFSGIAPIDTTLQGQPGSTITIPKYAYIGDAVEVAEGAAIDYTKLTTSNSSYKIKKVGKGVEITDEAVLSGYGDPIGEAKSQVTTAIASGIDNDTLVQVKKATLATTNDAFDATLIDSIEDVFNTEDQETGVLFMNPKDVTKLRKGIAEGWTRATDLGDQLLVTGVFGDALGWQVVRTRKVTQGEVYAVKVGALKTYLKRGVNPETGRDMDHKLTKFNADQHYVVALVNDSKVLKVVVTEIPAT
ncbi:N4-gp56 family major capsid protein [Carnobacterium pleistocenium]|uniref:N4-gp56 family major capsid protein n=1 Tax=Carnobacterium pleistocenium TaxID=181073 RepID=UPI000A93F759|nr:N4-gp56 family major capsid protein [Carnobacterium pleistocenium]